MTVGMVSPLSLQRPQLRKDLEIAPRFEAGEGFRYLAKDLLSGEIFDFSEKEYFLLRAFDGQTSISSIKESFQQAFDVSLETSQLEAFVRKLMDFRLLVSEWTEGKGRPAVARGLRSWVLFGPNRFLTVLARNLGACFSTIFLAFAIVVLGMAVGWAIKSGRDLIYELSFLVDTNWYFLVPILAIFIISPLVEICKGSACVHYGGRVDAFGVHFLYRIIPRFYCDVSDVFWFMKKSQRIRVFAAGLIAQSIVWAWGIIALANAEPASQARNFWFVFTIAATFLLFFRLNPLIELDGYHMLCTWLDIPDLRNRARAYTKSWILRKPLPEPLSPRERLIFKRYGLLSYLFETAFWGLVLTLAGYHLIGSLKGLGALLFLLILFLRFENVLTRQNMKAFFLGDMASNERGAVKLRLLVRLMIYAALIILIFIPYPYEAGGDFKLLPVDECGVRAQVPGEIESVIVKEGQWIQQGQVLAKLTGREQRKKVDELEATIDKLQANLTLLQKGAKPEEIAKARQEVKAAETSYSYSRTQAQRSEKMFKEKAITEQDYENALKVRDMDRERLELAKRNLELVESGFRDEQVRAIEAEIRAYEVELKHAKENLQLIYLISPIDGRVITPGLSEKVGQYINTGELFAVVEDARTLIVEIALPDEYLGEIQAGAAVKLRTWAYPTTVFKGRVTQIAPVAFERSRGKIERAYSDREWLIEQDQTIREKGRVIRVLCELDNSDELLKTDMTGYGKIECRWRPVGIAFTQWFTRFLFVEVWSWIP